MSLRPLVEGDCGGVNPLMQLQQQFTRDTALKDEGLSRMHFERGGMQRPEDQLVHEYLGQVTAPPQSFQMGALLQEMRDIEHGAHMPLPAAAPLPQMMGDARMANQWSKEFTQMPHAPPMMVHMQPQQQQIKQVKEFFDEVPSIGGMQQMSMFQPMGMAAPPLMMMSMGMGAQQQPQLQEITATNQFFDEVEANNLATSSQNGAVFNDWVKDYEESKETSEKAAADYNEKFWSRLQDEWQKLSEESDHPWLNEFNENYDPYKEYEFVEENPMNDVENVLAKGKEYLANGDIPSAVLCFEVAARQEPENAEAWELLGRSQAENEMDPQSIAALKRALDLQPNNMRVLMALAIGYTNESLQSQALKMLTRWMQANPKYSQLVEQYPELTNDGAASGSMATSLIRDDRLEIVQFLFLDAVRQQPDVIDAEVQEALGVLYNLSSEFDKAVDCFRSALQVQPQNAKIWNRLGASLANGTRSVEAVEAYQQALQLEPGFIRVRYNVGVCCMNLKAYKQAAEHFLVALNLQAQTTAAQRDVPAVATATGGSGGGSGAQQMSDAIWSTLKMVISLMGRSDLHPHVTERNLSALNEAFKE